MRTLLAIVAIASICTVVSITIVQGLASPRTGYNKLAQVMAESQVADDPVRATIQQDAAAIVAPTTDNAEKASTRGERLCQLSFLAGEWSSVDPNIEASAFYHWSPDRAFLLGEYTVKSPGKPEVSATQRFAYDASDRAIRQWVFFADGGYGEAVWTPMGKEWIAKTWGATGDGRYTSATIRVTPKGDDHVVWKVTDRIRGNEVVPEAESIPMVKKPMVAKQ